MLSRVCFRGTPLGLMRSVYQTSWRGLSAAETATALRPFYFAVHPDLFGQHPKERAVNEDSLKKLNQYLEGLHGSQTVTHTQLAFYVRQTMDSHHGTSTPPKGKNLSLREVRIALLSCCPRETVKTILRSCNLPLQYVDTITPKAAPAKRARARSWHDSAFYDFHGVPHPFGTRDKRKVLTLGNWLKKNVLSAKKKHEAIAPILAQIDRLKRHLRSELGIPEVLWQSQWGLVQFRSCLISFLRLYNQHQQEIHLKGHTLVFGSANGLCLRGHVILASDDVPDNWLQFLKRVRPQAELYEIISTLERALSAQLNRIQIVQEGQEQAVLVEDYVVRVRSLIATMDKFWMDHPDVAFNQNLSDLQLAVDSSATSMHLTDSGCFVIPSSCPGFLLVDFLARNAYQARQRAQEYESKYKAEKDLMDQVKDKFNLESLTLDSNISAEKAIDFCNALLDQSHDIGDMLSGVKVQISSFYSVMSDGEMCVPWNWYDEDVKRYQR